MSDAVVLAIIGAIQAITLAVIAVVQIRASRTAKVTNELTKDTHHMVNSQRTANEAAIRQLTAQVAEQKEAAALLAAAAASVLDRKDLR